MPAQLTAAPTDQAASSLLDIAREAGPIGIAIVLVTLCAISVLRWGMMPVMVVAKDVVLTLGPIADNLRRAAESSASAATNWQRFAERHERPSAAGRDKE